MNWQGACIHHSATRDSATSSWEAIRRWHIHHNGWRDIGYHFGIEDVAGSLRVRYGRPLDRPGAHAVGINGTHIGICVVGDFDRELPARETLDFLGLLIADLARAYDWQINSDTILYHTDMSGKSCPGELWPPKDVMTRIVKRWMAAT